MNKDRLRYKTDDAWDRHVAGIESWRKRNPKKARAIRRKAAKRFRDANVDMLVIADRWRKIKAKYGLSKEGWLALFLKQGRRCACCDTDTPDACGWTTDHDHFKKLSDVGFVRGILCSPCNIAVGYYESLRRTLVEQYLRTPL